MEKEKQIKYLMIIIFLLIGLIVGYSIKLYFENKPQLYTSKVIFDEDINNTEKICANNLINDINPILLKKIKSITFTYDDNKLPKNAQGVNRNSDITIKISKKWENVEWGLRNVICHEILHSWIVGVKDGDDLEEEFVNDINLRWIPCYPNLFKSSIQDDCSLKLLDKNSSLLGTKKEKQ